ncbi:Peptidase S8/S53, subtilisin/kexin/sedolisin [Metarhizium guizhouense ARSEF 977]|uniref:Peptidase S8/S53, subtilisin/kexin/sedolisin n=1 Tax=Metarhizium guizhouense (strain ARSEF 977) TaxID=1276136 RepID=A0A0B4GP25_METGA|nr:Peptidase S8/S53, subtilisin/kexin/sedolisin [Metarhizium guizhouense ARSEF 977]
MRRYEDVQALLICWKDATKTFQDQRTELQRVLRSPYNFGAEAIDIPSADPEKYLEDNIRKFREAHDKEQNLLLVYYGGHGDVLRLDGQLIIKCFDGIQHPYVEWNTRQKSFLKGSKADTLIILDCCHSASAIESIYCGQDNVVELLTACSIEGKAPLRGNHSLTSKLTDLLQSKELFTSGFDTSYLYNRLVHYQKLKGQVYLGDDEDEKGQLVLRRSAYEDEEDDAEITGVTGRESEPGKQDSQESGEAAHLSATLQSISYSDVATNTEWDLVIRRESAVSIQNQSVRSVYVDDWTNTATETAPLTKRQPAIQALGPVQIEPLTFYREPATRRPWRRKMAIEQDEQERDHRAWFHRYAIFLGQWGMAREAENRTSPYKIALLGTGVDCALILSHDCHQVIRGRNFTSTGENGGWDQEHAGHGASCLTMLLETAPFAEFFIAKITDRQRISNADTIAQSIEYSVKEWKVDRLHIHHDGVANAISQAIRQNIICLAATGNDGANTRAAFPARMHGVIPIFSTDSYGNPSPYNASPMRGRKNFSTFGENVRVWRDDRRDEPSYKSGTSFAVCIAAGMLAAMLVFARDYLQLDQRDWNTLHTPAGAEKYLELMSSSRGGYEYVAPWLLISNEILIENSSGSGVDFKDAIKSQIVTALRHLR